MKNKIKVRGSILIFTLITLSLLLVTALSVAQVSTSQTRTTIATDKSSIAFPIAESGAETILQRINSHDFDARDLNELGGAGSSCSGGVIRNSLSSGAYEVTLFQKNASGTLIPLTDCGDDEWKSKVDTLEAKGEYAGTVRAIRMSVTPGAQEAEACIGQVRLSMPGKVKADDAPVTHTNSWGSGVDFSGDSCESRALVTIGGVTYTITASGTFPGGSSSTAGGTCSATASQTINGTTYTSSVSVVITPTGSGATLYGEADIDPKTCN